MKILLLNPYYTYPTERYRYFRPTEPFNLLYLAGFLRTAGVMCEIKELGIFNESERLYLNSKVRFGLSDEEIIKSIKGYDLIGISSMYSLFYKDVQEIIRLIRKNSNAKIVVGGNNASSHPEHFPDADFVVVGEGEIALLDICRGEVKEHIVKYPLIDNLDYISFPAYDLIDRKRYRKHSNPYTIHKEGAGIISSRGCPNNCIYCTVKDVWGRRWRGRSPENVVKEIEFMIREYGIKEFCFLDDSVSADPKRFEGILDLMIARKIKVKWTTPNGIAYWTLTNKLLDKMKKAGCYRITFGIESGNLLTRQFIHKTYSLKQATELIKHANKIGMWTITTNIIGFPYETEAQMYDTLKYNLNCGTDFACFYLLAPQPSSEVYQYYKELFDFETDPFLLDEQGCDTTLFKKEQLAQIQKDMYKQFLRRRVKDYLKNPLLLLRKIRNIEDLRYFIKLFRLGLKMILRSLSNKKQTSKEIIYG